MNTMEAPSAPLGLDPHRVHLVDAYPPGQPVNFLFRGNNPTTTNGSHSTFNLTALVSALALSARTECSTSLPEGFTLYDLDLENPTDPGYYAEKSYWHAHASLGQLGTPSLPGVWTTLGSVLEPKHTPARDVLVRDGKWALQGHADHLAARLNATRALMLDTNGGPKVLFTHCNAGPPTNTQQQHEHTLQPSPAHHASIRHLTLCAAQHARTQAAIARANSSVRTLSATSGTTSPRRTARRVSSAGGAQTTMRRARSVGGASRCSSSVGVRAAIWETA